MINVKFKYNFKNNNNYPIWSMLKSLEDLKKALKKKSIRM